MQISTVRAFAPFVVLMVVLSSCSNSQESTKKTGQSPIAVEVQKSAITNTVNDLQLSGNIEGLKTVKLGFMVPGKVMTISTKEGQLINQSQLLAAIDPTSYQISRQLSEVHLNAVKDEYRRISLMHERGSVSESDYTKSGFSLQEAELNEKQQQKNLSDTKLYSALTGILLNKQVEAGEIIAAGTPLFTISDIRRVQVSTFIPEGEIHDVTLGQKANVKISALDSTFTGIISEIGALADPTTRAFTSKIVLDNHQMLIRPGMIAEIQLKGKSSKDCIMVPIESVYSDPDNQSHIFIVDMEQKKAFKRKVTLGSLRENKVEITSGLSPDEVFITASQFKITDGSSITILNK